MCSRRRGNYQTGRKPGQSICQGVCINPRAKNPVVFWISPKSSIIYICEIVLETLRPWLKYSVTMLPPKYLNPRVAPIRNKNIVLVVDSHPRWCVELTIAFTWWFFFRIKFKPLRHFDLRQSHHLCQNWIWRRPLWWRSWCYDYGSRRSRCCRENLLPRSEVQQTVDHQNHENQTLPTPW